MKSTTRRNFLQRSTLATAALTFPFPFVARGQLSASDEIRMGVIGFHGRGGDHLSGLSKVPGVRIRGLCDVDETVLGKEKQKWTDQGYEIEAQRDLRDFIESKNIDAVSIATPNHWHSLAAIWAIQAGKDVYLEKPVSHNVWEGRQLVLAARKFQRIVQTGTQTRSSRGIRECFAWLHEGNLGKITLARGFCYKPRPSIGKVSGPQPIPAGIDYDLWCGPAPMRPLMRKNLHYDWHWVWDTGNGDLGNQGIHQMDIARWALGVKELSPRVLSLGGRLGYVDDGETANTQIVYHDYPEAPLIFEVRGLPSRKDEKNMDSFPHPKAGRWLVPNADGGEPKEVRAGIAAVIECSGGYILVPDYNAAHAFDRDGKHLRSWSGSDNHFENFIRACRSRKSSDLNADILEGHLSSALCHTGNISYRLGHQRSPNEIRDALKKNPGLSEAFGRMAEHLQSNEVDLLATRASLGVMLAMDPKSERFIGDKKANQMLTREYRKPYVVPSMA